MELVEQVGEKMSLEVNEMFQAVLLNGFHYPMGIEFAIQPYL
jgi:hypothetical protein